VPEPEAEASAAAAARAELAACAFTTACTALFTRMSMGTKPLATRSRATLALEAPETVPLCCVPALSRAVNS